MLGRVRVHVLGSRPARGLTLASGATAVVAGVLMAAGGQWGVAAIAVLAAGVVTWLGGAWVVPGSEDAYRRRVERSVGEGVGRLGGSYETFERYARRQRARLERLRPPARLEEEHARLLDLLGQADRAANHPSRPLKARAAEATRALQRARDQRMALIDQRDDAAHRRYAEAIAKLGESSQALIEGAFDRAEESVAAMVAELERTRPPTKLASRHESLVEVSRDYLEAMRAYHDAVRELDPDGVAGGAARGEQAKVRLNEAVKRLGAR